MPGSAKKKPEERVILTMTREQAYAVMNATELLARLYIGQVFTVPQLLGDFKDADYAERSSRANDAFTLGVKILVGENAYGYPDIEEKSIEHERCWAVYATIRHAIAWHDNPEGNRWGVAFDRPMAYSHNEAMPKCEIRTVKED